ncbi:hypothetical protein RI367_000999 [Sorochytrium milnesiophthora]
MDELWRQQRQQDGASNFYAFGAAEETTLSETTTQTTDSQLERWLDEYPALLDMMDIFPSVPLSDLYHELAMSDGNLEAAAVRINEKLGDEGFSDGGLYPAEIDEYPPTEHCDGKCAQSGDGRPCQEHLDMLEEHTRVERMGKTKRKKRKNKKPEPILRAGHFQPVQTPNANARYMPVEDYGPAGWAPASRPTATAKKLTTQDLHEQRAFYYNEARSAIHNMQSSRYGNGKFRLGGEVAMVRAEQARAITPQIHGRMKDEARQIVSARQRERRDENSLDLHGIHIREARELVEEMVNEWYIRTTRANPKPSKPFRIVVGRGSHSEHGQSRLYPAVMGVLRQGNWRVQDEASNLGQILVLDAARR